MQKRKKITNRTDSIITIILGLIVVVIGFMVYAAWKSDSGEFLGLMFISFIDLLLFLVFINKITKKLVNYNRVERVLSEGNSKNLKITEIINTGAGVGGTGNDAISTEYVIRAEDENQVYISSPFYVHKIDEYARVGDNITVYAINGERLNYYVDLKSITLGNGIKDTTKSGLSNNLKLCEKADKDPLGGYIRKSFGVFFIIIGLASLLESLMGLIFIVIGGAIIKFTKLPGSKYNCINKGNEVKGKVESIEEIKGGFGIKEYIVNVKANGGIYKSEKTKMNPKLSIGDTVNIYIDRNDFNKYYVYLYEDKLKYNAEFQKNLNNKINENHTAFLMDPGKVIKESMKDESIEKDKTKKESAIEESYPYLLLEPKKVKVSLHLLKNRKLIIIGFMIILMGCSFLSLKYRRSVILIIRGIIILYQSFYTIYESYIQEKLTKKGVKKLTKISRIERKKELIAYSSNNKNNENNNEDNPQYYYIIYTTDGNKEYKSFKVKNPFVKVGNPLYVYIDPDNEKLYWVDTSNISFDVMDFFTKILGSIFRGL